VNFLVTSVSLFLTVIFDLLNRNLHNSYSCLGDLYQLWFFYYR